MDDPYGSLSPLLGISLERVIGDTIEDFGSE